LLTFRIAIEMEPVYHRRTVVFYR